jgi:quercetin dioxygenase-like cupin family protein
MQIVRFGAGHRRPEGPAGSRGVQGQVIHSDDHGVVAELAFGRHGSIQPHSNPNNAWLVVIEGGGFVQVGDEQARVAAGEAVHWPADIPHAAWTEQSQMRAIVIEFAAHDAVIREILDGRGVALPAGDAVRAAAAEGHLETEGTERARYDPAEGEPF